MVRQQIQEVTPAEPCLHCGKPDCDDEAKCKRRAKRRERYHRNRAAVIARNVEYAKHHRSENNARERKRYAKKREVILATRQERREEIRQQQQVWRDRNREALRERERQYREQNALFISQRMSEWGRTETGKAVRRQADRKRRAKKKQVHHVTVSAQQIAALQAAWNGCCAYCGSRNISEIDHFIPLSKGGPDCLGNYLPSCEWCNSSKHNDDPLEWYSRQSFYSLKRWQDILKFLGLSQVGYRQLPLF